MGDAGSYRRDWLRPDLIAGVVIWSVVTPQAVAYAQIAGLPPAAGLMPRRWRWRRTRSGERRASSS